MRLAAPPCSLYRRENTQYSSENREKSPQLRRFCSQTVLEKVPHFTQPASFVALFSEGHIGSPVSTTPPGERNAIANRSFGESRVDFFLSNREFVRVSP